MSEIKVGQRVIVNSSGCSGTVRFTGTTSFAPDAWVGVELDTPTGKNDGSVQGKRYFQCQASHGIFVRPPAVSAQAPVPAGSEKPSHQVAATQNSQKYAHRGPDGQWNEFDDATNAIIAAARQRGDSAVELPEVMSNPPGSRQFEIRFGDNATSEKMKRPSDTGICQVNLANNNTRKVKLLVPGEDIEALDVPTPARKSVVGKDSNAANSKRTSNQTPTAPSRASKRLSTTVNQQVASTNPQPIATASPQPTQVVSPQAATSFLAGPPEAPTSGPQTVPATTGQPQTPPPRVRLSRRQAPSFSVQPCPQDEGEEDPLIELTTTAGTATAEPEPEVTEAGVVSLSARVEYSALPRGLSQDVFGLVTVKGNSPPEVPQTEASDPVKEERQPMDIVCVLDVSGSMQGDKISQVQNAVRFVIDQAKPNDRLGIIAFNHEATKVLRLRRMDAEGKNDANVGTLRLSASGGTSIASGLDMAIRMMEGRRQRNKVSAILLLTDGQDGSTRSRVPALISRVEAARCSLYSFGFGADHDAALLSEIAEQARTPFTFVEDVDAIREAFAGVVGGLASVVAQNIELTLKSKVPLTSVHTPFEIRRTSDQEVTVVIPDIMAEERKDILVEMAIPADPAAPPTTMLLEASAVYCDLKSGGKMQTPAIRMEADRCDEPQPELEPDEEVSAQRERVEVAQALKQAAACSDRGDFDEAKEVIERSEVRIRSKKTKNSEAMCLELQDAKSRMQSRSSWEQGGRAEVSDARQMHSMQRCAMESGSSRSAVCKKSKAMYVCSAQSSMISKSKGAY